MTSLKQPLLNLFAGICLLIFIVAVIDIVSYWLYTGFDWMYLGKKLLYALAAGYWVWRLLIQPYRKRNALEAENS